MECPEAKKDFEQIVKKSLERELHKMKDRNPERGDIKFKVLRQFLAKLSNQPFEVVYGQLNEVHRHAIITRLENQAKHMGGDIPYDFIKNLEQKLYGLARDKGGIDFEKKMELEKRLRSEGKFRYNGR